MGKVVERYKGSSALDTWLLLNEPDRRRLRRNWRARPSLRAEKKYAGIADLNRAWGTNYASFAEVEAQQSRTTGILRRDRLDGVLAKFPDSQLAWMAAGSEAARRSASAASQSPCAGE